MALINLLTSNLKIMKRLSIISLCSVLLSFTLGATEPTGDFPPARKSTEATNIGAPFDEQNVYACFFIGGEIGIKERGCRGLGLSCTTFEREVGFGEIPPKGKIQLCIIKRSEKAVQLVVTPPSGKIIENFVIEREIKFETQVANKLGYSSLKVVPGTYSTTRNSDGKFVVELNVKGQ